MADFDPSEEHLNNREFLERLPKKEIQALLDRLTTLKAEILYERLVEATNPEIAKKYGRSTSWVEGRMREIFDKFELDTKEDNPKDLQSLLKEYFYKPFMESIEADPANIKSAYPIETDEEITPEERLRPGFKARTKANKASEEPEAVKQDEQTEEIGVIPWRLLGLTALIAAALGIAAGFYAARRLSPPPPAIVITATPALTNLLVNTPSAVAPSASQQLSTETVASTAEIQTTDTLSPTSTPISPSASSVPTEPKTPFPAGYALVYDFSNGLDSAWTIQYGKPIIVNSQLTSNDPTLLSVGDPSWKDYQVEFDVTFKFQDCNLEDNSSGLGVRATDSDNMLLYVFSNCYSSWDYMVGGTLSMVPNAQLGGLVKPIHYMIKAVGNKISTYNGPKLLVSFVDTDHLTGNIYLRIKPQTLFGNFKITFLNP